MKPTPSDEARAAAPKLHLQYEDFAKTVYPELDPLSAQYREMEMVWHVASMNFLNNLANITDAHDEDMGADVIQCMNEEIRAFLDQYAEQRRVESGQPEEGKEQ